MSLASQQDSFHPHSTVKTLTIAWATLVELVECVPLVLASMRLALSHVSVALGTTMRMETQTVLVFPTLASFQCTKTHRWKRDSR